MSGVLEADYDEFTSFENLPSCSIVETLEYFERCNYTKASEECQAHDSHINYLHVLYCIISPQNNFHQVLGILVLLMFCVIMFAVLGIVADKFFVPSLKVISTKLGMSEHLAGVTLLAFGNGAPDLFTSWVSANDPKKLHFSDLIGSSIYVFSFVGGLVCLLYPFKIQANNLIRDILFFIFAVLYIDYVIISDGGITVVESAGIMLIYMTYITVVILDTLFIKIHVKMLELQTRNSVDVAKARRLTELQGQNTLEYFAANTRHSVDIRMTRRLTYTARNRPNQQLFKQFKNSINPIDENQWNNGLLFKRIYLLVKAPLIFVLLFILPIVDYELPAHGWSKLLNVIQLVTFPFLLMYGLTFTIYTFGFPIAVYTFIVTVPAAIALFLTSRTDIPPKFHLLFVFFSIFGSIFLIYSCANETVEILSVLGIVTHASNAFLGCTVLAWGNGIGDLVSLLTLAKHGYRKMAFAASLGGPFFNSLMSMGGSFLVKVISEKDSNSTKINEGIFGENCLVFILMILTGTIFWALSTNFMARRSTGAFQITMYGLFLLFALLGELELIQTYAPQSANG